MAKRIDESYQEYKLRVLDPISPSFCAAKWQSATIWLGSGQTASCHHVPMHSIDSEAVRKAPHKLHNTEQKKAVRDALLRGEHPRECDYCWRAEALGESVVSDRVLKSAESSDIDIRRIVNDEISPEFYLQKLEIAFDRTCNFACSYCNASFSSRWGKELRSLGPYRNLVSDGAKAYQQDGQWVAPYRAGRENPFLRAFWQWWPELRKNLKELRITGGEPLLSQDFWRLLEVLREQPVSGLRIAVNSNLGINFELVERLAAATIYVPELDVYTSCEATAQHAEYIRDGLNYNDWCKNIEYLLSQSTLRTLNVMMTVNSLCLFSITDLLDQVMNWKVKYGKKRVLFSINILRFPSFMSPVSLPSRILNKCFLNITDWYERNGRSELISEWEAAGLTRLLHHLEKTPNPHSRTSSFNSRARDFKSFYQQYDERRGKSFAATFPTELVAWYQSIPGTDLETLTEIEIENHVRTDGWILHPQDKNPS